MDIVLPRENNGAVAVRYHPPADIAALLVGKRPEEAVRAVSAIYGICANAQAHAAVLALEAALGIEATPVTVSARALVTAMECLRENVLRIALDWPRLTGTEPIGASVRNAIGFVPEMRRALFGETDPFAPGAQASPDHGAADAVIADAEILLEQAIFGEPLDLWSRRRGNLGILSWAVGTQTPAADLIVHLVERGWVEAADEESERADFLDAAILAGCAQPAKSTVPETTLFSRRALAGPVLSLDSSGLGARYVARLAELAWLPREMKQLLEGKDVPDTVSRLSDGRGVGIVEAARGLLAHRVRLEEGLVTEYRIISPTDWNFDAKGVAARCLSALDGHGDADEKVELAHLVVNAIDPCVAYEVRHC
ncbi:nickel-dependent hydrogenase large subunit [Oricola thermophila]|uniref:Nickel-dependent hydrogenase large subunit n=1 Tax=Oricola thermophila TaxID=2742145 RepID=A0A6N1V9B2_9HYPH|nr:nickel-dependent hydrogenase large subunit [Oricola thermophila]QKV17318.1 nickel-dependent hydrogenase large subunit [Oricola thermophila]